MCPEQPLILLANRDEFYQRATQAMGFWAEAPHVLAGKDLEGGGTWLGANLSGRFGFITNIRRKPKPNRPSRGDLLRFFLDEQWTLEQFNHHLVTEGPRYNGFNLIYGDVSELYYYNSDVGEIRQLAAGIYGLSNAQLDTPWFKVEKGKAAFDVMLQNGEYQNDEALFALMADREKAPEHLVPETEAPRAFERDLSSLFVARQDYGTWCTTLLRCFANGRLHIKERNYVHGTEQYEDAAFSISPHASHGENL